MGTILAFSFLLSVVWGAYHLCELSKYGVDGYIRRRIRFWCSMRDAHERYQQSRVDYGRQLGVEEA